MVFGRDLDASNWHFWRFRVLCTLTPHSVGLHRGSVSGRLSGTFAGMTYSPKKKSVFQGEPRVTLKTVAAYLGLTPGTVSAALNNSPAARSIPERTKKRILEAAKDLNYRPNYFARSLRLQRTYTIGVIAEEICDSYGSMVISGVEECL